MRESLFVTSERRRVIIASAVVMDRRVMDVKHFVKDDVFDHEARNIVSIERTADDYRFVGRIMVSQYAVRFSSRPSENRFSKPATKVPEV